MMTMLLALLLLAAAPDVSNTYRIETPAVKVKKGAPATARVEVVPAKDAHVSPDAPISLTVSGGPGLALTRQKLGRDDAKQTAANGVEFDVPFTASAKDQLKGTLTFFICTEKLCEKQKREIALAVEVE